jgi:hypothetical protein
VARVRVDLTCSRDPLVRAATTARTRNARGGGGGGTGIGEKVITTGPDQSVFTFRISLLARAKYLISWPWKSTQNTMTFSLVLLRKILEGERGGGYLKQVERAVLYRRCDDLFSENRSCSNSVYSKSVDAAHRNLPSAQAQRVKHSSVQPTANTPSPIMIHFYLS